MTRRAAPVVAFVGPHNSGKTGLVETLTRLASRRGLQVGVIKRAAQPLALDPSGKDSARFAAAGAQRVVAAGPGRLFMMEQTDESPAFGSIRRRFSAGIDFWLAESYVAEPVPWVAVAKPGAVVPEPDQYCIATVGHTSSRRGIPKFTFRQPGRLLTYLIRICEVRRSHG